MLLRVFQLTFAPDSLTKKLNKKTVIGSNWPLKPFHHHKERLWQTELDWFTNF